MENNAAYISFPVTEGTVLREEIADELEESGWNPTTWPRGTKYNEKLLEDAKIVIFYLPLNRFEMRVSSLPNGLAREYQKARELKKDIYIAYRPKGESYFRFYKTVNSLTAIEGIAGTVLHDYDIYLEFEEEEKENLKPLDSYDNIIQVSTISSFDQRLLLLL